MPDNRPQHQQTHQQAQSIQPASGPNPSIPVTIEVITPVMKPADTLLRQELGNLMFSLCAGEITATQAKLQLHEWFRSLDSEQQMFLYLNDRAKKEAQRISNFGVSLQQEMPALMSQVKF